MFRLLDAAIADPLQPTRHAARQSFTPRFDVREAGSNYELQGELPGFEQKDLDIEFVDERTLVIKGKHRSDKVSTHAFAATEESQSRPITDSPASEAASDKSSNYHKASVEEEYVDAGAESEAAGEKASTDEGVKAVEQDNRVEPDTYWISERSTGAFERRFRFPGQVNHDEVKASLKNGILNIVVPKIVEEAKRIAIQ